MFKQQQKQHSVESFLQAVQWYGLPSRIRCDQGTENILVCQHNIMLHHRGTERRSVLVGSSVYNQRIECLWRDMHRCVTGTFYNFLERHNMLDPINEAHLCALHYIFLPRINQGLMRILEPPSCQHRKRNVSKPVIHFWGKKMVLQSMTGRVLRSHQAVLYILSDAQLHQLQDSVNPLTESDNCGIELYLQALDIIHNVH